MGKVVVVGKVVSVHCNTPEMCETGMKAVGGEMGIERNRGVPDLQELEAAT